MKLPESFKEEMKALLGEEYEAYQKSFEEAVRPSLRVNTGKISAEAFEKEAPFQLEKVPWIENGYYYRAEENPAKHPCYLAGLYYLQEASAMTPASRLPVSPGDRVLDLCAAPGGKATELGAKLQGRGMLLANDISNSRAKALLRNLEVQGVGNVLVTSEEPGRLAACYPEFFDKILLDAPCSGEGMFRKEPSMLRYFEENGPEHYVPIQRTLTEQAYQMLRPGGLLMYSTCTFSTKENEEIIAGLLNRHPDLELLELTPYAEGFSGGISMGGQDLHRCVHIFPHRMRGEGHFLALLHRKGDERRERPAGQVLSGSRSIPEEAAEFLKQIRRDWSEGSFLLVKDQLYYLSSEMAPVKGLRYLRTGLLLGTCKKGRFEPSQALAMNLRAEEFSGTVRLAWEDERILRYLKGETLDLSDLAEEKQKGWALVCAAKYPLGFGKLSGGRLKNKYYAGWRLV